MMQHRVLNTRCLVSKARTLSSLLFFLLKFLSAVFFSQISFFSPGARSCKVRFPVSRCGAEPLARPLLQDEVIEDGTEKDGNVLNQGPVEDGFGEI